MMGKPAGAFNSFLSSLIEAARVASNAGVADATTGERSIEVAAREIAAFFQINMAKSFMVGGSNARGRRAMFHPFRLSGRSAQPASNRIGRRLSPPTNTDLTRAGSPASSRLLQPRQQFLHQDLHLHAREMLTETDMCPEAEGDLLVLFAIGIESERVAEHRFVAVSET